MNSPFMCGDKFGSKEEVKQMIKKHAVDTRRQLRIIKDDLSRARAVCWGDIPHFDESGNLKSVDGHTEIRYGKKTMGVSGRCRGTGHNIKTCKNPKVVVEKDSNSKDKGQNVKHKGEVGSSNTSKDKGEVSKYTGGRGKKAINNKHQCPWTLLLSKVSGSETLVIKAYVDEHKCLQNRNIRACTTTFISKQLMEQLHENPTIPVKAVQEQFQRKFDIGLSHMKAYRAKTKAMLQITGDYNAQYRILRDYYGELMNKNPGTIVHIEVQPCGDPKSIERVFKRIYVCLGALKQGFKAIGRDMLGLDGAFIKGPYPGQVLSAVGVDPNNGIYPVSYAIVEAETTDSGSWFLECLADDLDLDVNSHFTFRSDRQKGMIPAIEKLFPLAEHRYCLRHINENMKQQFKGHAFKDNLSKAAKATTVQEFEKEMDALKAFNSDCHLWLDNIPASIWVLLVVRVLI